MVRINIRDCDDPFIWEAYHSSPISITEGIRRINAQILPILRAQGYSEQDLNGYYFAEFVMGVEPQEMEQQAVHAYSRIERSPQVESFAEHMARAGLHTRLAKGMKMMIEAREGEA